MRQKCAGFTLIELVVTTAIVAVIGVVFAQIFSSGLSNYVLGRELVADDAQARLALERMSRDIRMARSAADISVFLPTRLVFVDNTGLLIDFQHSAATQQLTRAEAGGTAQPLADLVQGMNFTYQQTDGVSAGYEDGWSDGYAAGFGASDSSLRPPRCHLHLFQTPRLLCLPAGPAVSPVERSSSNRACRASRRGPSSLALQTFEICFSREDFARRVRLPFIDCGRSSLRLLSFYLRSSVFIGG